MKEKKKKNIFVYFIGMFFLFLALFLTEQTIGSIASSSILNGKFGSEALFEMFWALTVLIVLLLWKNSYVFTQKQDSFFKALKYGIPFICMSLVFLLFGIGHIIDAPTNAVLNLAIYCASVGIVEEFFCRGWLLNEFFEKFSDNKKHIFISIILSSLVFGLIHFVNILAGQDFITTFTQVCNATCIGIIYSLIYYKTKNIWAVVFLHGFWDFALMSLSVDTVVDTTYGAVTTPVIIYNLVTLAFVLISNIILIIGVYRAINFNQKESKKNGKCLLVFGAVLYVVSLAFIPMPDSVSDYYITHDYKEKELNGAYSLKTYSDNVKFKTTLKKELVKEVILEDETISTKTEVIENVILFEDVDGSLRVSSSLEPGYNNLGYLYDSFIVVNNKDSIAVLFIKDTTKIMYGYFEKSILLNQGSVIDYIRDNLKEFETNELKDLAELSINGKEEKYACAVSTTGEMFYFEKDKIYLVK